ncbi:MAG: MalT-like region [Acidobacteriota bacterium]|jgi:tetratricopeptide (TPR) repeat protein|nr:MalT-like region [Acidobacteriota bacterium]
MVAQSTADKYLELFTENVQVQKALLACSAALRLDDEIAQQAIEIVAQSNGSTNKLLQMVKNLGCVWQQWDGSWFIAEEIRRGLQQRLYEFIEDQGVLTELRESLARYADQRAVRLPRDGYFTVYQSRQAKFEAAIQRLLSPELSKAGAAQLVEMYEPLSEPAKRATENAVEYLASDLEKHMEELPAEVLFFRGMAARAKKDRRSREDQIYYFTKIRDIGGFGYVFGVALHFLGLLLRDPAQAEQVMRESIRAYETPQHKAQVLLSIGDLLSDQDKDRWPDAEKAYKDSYALRTDPQDCARVLHSLGHLYAKNETRWDEAEKAYKDSFELRRDPADKAQVLHSIGKLLSHDKNKARWPEAKNFFKRSYKLDPNVAGKVKVLTSWADLLLKSGDRKDWSEAERFARECLKLDEDNSKTKGMCNRILARVYEKRGDLTKAIESLEIAEETCHQLNNKRLAQNIRVQINRLRKRLRDGSQLS